MSLAHNKRGSLLADGAWPVVAHAQYAYTCVLTLRPPFLSHRRHEQGVRLLRHCQFDCRYPHVQGHPGCALRPAPRRLCPDGDKGKRFGRALVSSYHALPRLVRPRRVLVDLAVLS